MIINYPGIVDVSLIVNHLFILTIIDVSPAIVRIVAEFAHCQFWGFIGEMGMSCSTQGYSKKGVAVAHRDCPSRINRLVSK